MAQSRGAQVLWLAPYLPDFSPIEQCWSKIKSYLRGAQARTGQEIDKALAQAIGLVTRADIRGWFRHCGYSHANESRYKPPALYAYVIGVEIASERGLTSASLDMRDSK